VASMTFFFSFHTVTFVRNVNTIQEGPESQGRNTRLAGGAFYRAQQASKQEAELRFSGNATAHHQ